MKLSNIYRKNQIWAHQYLILSDINLFKKILRCFSKMSRNYPDSQYSLLNAKICMIN